jgi:hydrogenase nickel incorporation protein HypA/HybF
MTTQIVDTILAEAGKHKAKRVTAVHLKIGSLSFLNPDQVRFAFKVLSKDSILEKSRLYITLAKGEVRCPKCRYQGPLNVEDDPALHIPYPTLMCPKCSSIVEIIAGKGCEITSMKVGV